MKVSLISFFCCMLFTASAFCVSLKEGDYKEKKEGLGSAVKVTIQDNGNYLIQFMARTAHGLGDDLVAANLEMTPDLSRMVNLPFIVEENPMVNYKGIKPVINAVQVSEVSPDATVEKSDVAFKVASEFLIRVKESFFHQKVYFGLNSDGEILSFSLAKVDNSPNVYTQKNQSVIYMGGASSLERE